MPNPVLPQLYGFTITKKPTFASQVRRYKSGRQVSGAQQTFPLWEFELKYESLRDQTQNSAPYVPNAGYTDLTTLVEYFNYCNGQYGRFLYEDLSDCSRVLQTIGVGDGVTLNFVFVRTIDHDGVTFTEPVGRVNENHTITVYKDGVEFPAPGNWSISDDGTMLLFASAPATDVVIAVDFYFYYLCRFITDEQDFEEFVKNWWTASLKFRSVLPYMPINSLPSWIPRGPVPSPVPPPVTWFARSAVADGNVEFWRFPPMSPGRKGTLSFWAKVASGDDFLALYGAFSGPVGAPNSGTMYFQPSYVTLINFKITSVTNAANAIITIVGDLTQVPVGSEVYLTNVNQYVPASPHRIIVSVIGTGTNTITVAWNTSALGAWNPSLNVGASLNVAFIKDISAGNPAVITFSIPHQITSAGGYTRVDLATITQGGGWAGFGSGAGGVLVLGHTSTTLTIDADSTGFPAYDPLQNIVRVFVQNAISIFLANSDQSRFTNLITTTPLVPGTWVNVLSSWDTDQAAGSKKCDLYFNDSPVTVLAFQDYFADFTINYGEGLPDTSYNIGWKMFGNGGVSGVGFAGAIAEIWFDISQYIDFSNSSNRLLFHSAGLKSIDLGATGDGPTGSAPLIYMGLNTHNPGLPDPNLVFIDPLGYSLSQAGGLISTTTKFVLSFWLDRNTRGDLLFPDGYVDITLNTNSDPPLCQCYISSTGSAFTQFEFEYDVGRGGNIRMQCDFTGGARDVIVYYNNTLATVVSTGDSPGEIAIAWDQGADFFLFLGVRGYIGEFWFGPGQYFNVASKFIDGSGNPVDLGPTGALPSGTSPVVFLHLNPGDPASAWGTNHGTGSGFAQSGSFVLVSGSRISDNLVGTGDLIVDNEGNAGFLGYDSGPAP